jgi:ATP-dependent Clp protease, protease subunit
MNNWFEFKAFAGSRKLYLYDDIGKGGITAKAFREELEKFKGPIDIHINSAGGVVTEGISIYNTLLAYTGKKTVYIDSLAASMASVIAMAGNQIFMPENALMMLHNPWGNAAGDSRELRKTADILDLMKSVMIDAYHLKSGIDREELTALLDNETWLNGNAALSAGFIDGLSGQVSEEEISQRKQAVTQGKIKLFEEAETASTFDIRESAQKIMSARRNAPGTAIFKTQNQKPSNYLGIKQ